MRIEMYQSKDQQSRFFREHKLECHLWLTQNFHPHKTSSVMLMLEQMVETRSSKKIRGLIEDGRFRVCPRQYEPVEHLAAGFIVLSNSEDTTEG